MSQGQQLVSQNGFPIKIRLITLVEDLFGGWSFCVSNFSERDTTYAFQTERGSGFGAESTRDPLT